MLRKEEGLKLLPRQNARLTGISIDGQILACSRDRVQVKMEIDVAGGEAAHYWFPYSTVVILIRWKRLVLYAGKR